MFIHKAFKFRLYPNQKQMELIHKTIGCSRFVFNLFLGKQKEKDAYWSITEEMKQNGQLSSNNWKGDYLNKYETIKELPELKRQYSFLKEVDSIALQKSIENLADAYSRYYKKQNKLPRFKSKKNPVQSYVTKHTNGNIAVIDDQIKLPKLGLVRFAKSREVHGRILSATIRRNPSGKYFVSLTTEVEGTELPKTNSAVGIDVGLKDFAILSDGTIYSNPKFFRSLEEKLVKAQRILSRRQERALQQKKPLNEAKNYQKQRKKVARIHEKIVNARTDYLQKISTEIIKNHDVIGIEDLKVANMRKNHHLAKAISEASWSQFRTMLEYKAEWYGKTIIAVNPTRTSQRCHACGHTEKANRPSQAEFVCQKCGHTDNADVNASKNIKELALAV
ncbi:IS200/IS605 family element RNA-guided endonuclease TnpB [Peribacillus asahii]|uniref:IS200/IS605 family element RNA-guided endonuclease TnpB n=1 Tax=Peribacillus asahii TaxID=228899 RepID=UPI00207A526F|nr:IS200/IS605 family element RNA-guided endonuclease TnpB [Peribacillus asahii]USK71141.1 IS200/IS605 family element transposase accessory protein TnpB [Peribacillus asahii]